MITDEIREVLARQPFVPFVVCMADGRPTPVRRPEYGAISPGGSTAIIHVDDEAAEVIHMVQVTRVRFEPEPTAAG